MDLDFFKKVNDTYGHAAGDRVLYTIAIHCRSMLRGTDIIGRFGGEEFVFCLPETDRSGSRVIAERLRQIIANRPVLINDEQSISITASFGLHTINPEDFSDFFGKEKNSQEKSLLNKITVEDILKKADQALYRAKELGRNRIESN